MINLRDVILARKRRHIPYVVNITAVFTETVSENVLREVCVNLK